MIRSLVQFRRHGERAVAGFDAAGTARHVVSTGSTLALAQEAIATGRPLAFLAAERAGDPVDLAGAELLLPVDGVPAERVLVSGTGLTHLGSAEGRDKMHRAAASGDLTDSMRMFLAGLEGGKPAPGVVGTEPEWFYKGDGAILVPSGAPLTMPSFSGDGGEEPEIAGIYLVGDNDVVHRLGFVLGNEFSDHVTERQNYLLLASSKLRQAALGPELLLGDLPADVRGTSRIWRGNELVWDAPFLSGESNMCHTLANLEHHHFKHPQFGRPGLLHVHFFGTATLSFSQGIAPQPGDVFEIAADAFHLPLRSPLARGAERGTRKVTPL